MKTWAIAGYLQKHDGNEIQGQPVVGWARNDNKEQAVGNFFLSIKEKHKGWAVFDIVIVEIPQEERP